MDFEKKERKKNVALICGEHVAEKHILPMMSFMSCKAYLLQ